MKKFNTWSLLHSKIEAISNLPKIVCSRVSITNNTWTEWPWHNLKHKQRTWTLHRRAFNMWKFLIKRWLFMRCSEQWTCLILKNIIIEIENIKVINLEFRINSKKDKEIGGHPFKKSTLKAILFQHKEIKNL